jgi:hypothetical protein
VTDVKAFRRPHGNILERLKRKGWMVFQYELVNRSARLGCGPSDTDEAHDRAISTRLLQQSVKFLVRV